MRPVTGFFNLVRAHNYGAAFSFLHTDSGWQRWFFVGLGAVASAFIVGGLIKAAVGAAAFGKIERP